ncbi:MAG: hypothetical protein IT210_24925, partial [Armatimonadetes bacterium]|nr:hypothetical protein [Armatimonadota bacterium]
MQEWLIWGAVLALCSLLAVEGQAQELPYGIGKWPEAMGNHRVRVKVSEGGDAVRAHLPWRCRGRNPQAKAVLAVDAATGREIAHTAVIEVNREYGDIAFQPISGPDEYYLYYLPYTANPINHAYQITYAAPRDTAEAAWLQKHGLGKARLAEGRWKSLPEAQPLEIQARGEFHRFDPVEVIATAEKTKRLLSAHASEPFLLF